MSYSGLDKPWPKYRPDYWAGTVGGRPLGKRAPIPHRGDTLPREPGHTLLKAFHRHEDAVAYAKRFNTHAQIHTVWREDVLGERHKMFLVNPAHGRQEHVYGYTTGKYKKNKL